MREQPAAEAQGNRSLPPGTLLRVIDFEGGWAVIARDGERLGYVPAEALVRMQ